MTPDRKNSMNKQERAAGLLALCLLVLTVLCSLVPAKAAAFSLRVPPEPTALPRLNIPALAFLHGRDELVSPRSRELLQACPSVTVTVLEGSMHHDIAPADRQTVLMALREMCVQE